MLKIETIFHRIKKKNFIIEMFFHETKCLTILVKEVKDEEEYLLHVLCRCEKLIFKQIYFECYSNSHDACYSHVDVRYLDTVNIPKNSVILKLAKNCTEPSDTFYKRFRKFNSQISSNKLVNFDDYSNEEFLFKNINKDEDMLYGRELIASTKGM